MSVGRLLPGNVVPDAERRGSDYLNGWTSNLYRLFQRRGVCSVFQPLHPNVRFDGVHIVCRGFNHHAGYRLLQSRWLEGVLALPLE